MFSKSVGPGKLQNLQWETTLVKLFGQHELILKDFKAARYEARGEAMAASLQHRSHIVVNYENSFLQRRTVLAVETNRTRWGRDWQERREGKLRPGCKINK